MNAAFSDIVNGLRRWPLIFLLGWRDTVSAYRRSFLGPIWLAIQTALWVFFIGLVFGTNLGENTNTYLIYVAIGMVSFQLMSLIISDGMGAFVREATIIKNIPIPVSVFVFQVGARAFFTFWVEMVVIVCAFIWVGIIPNIMDVLISLGALLLTIWAFIGAAFGLAALTTIARDIMPIIQVALRLAFFATPIFWYTEGVTGARLIISTLNPFAHFMVIIRNPLMDVPVAPHSWYICIGLGVGFWVIGTSLFSVVHSGLATKI